MMVVKNIAFVHVHGRTSLYRLHYSITRSPTSTGVVFRPLLCHDQFKNNQTTRDHENVTDEGRPVLGIKGLSPSIIHSDLANFGVLGRRKPLLFKASMGIDHDTIIKLKCSSSTLSAVVFSTNTSHSSWAQFCRHIIVYRKWFWIDLMLQRMRCDSALHAQLTQ